MSKKDRRPVRICKGDLDTLQELLNISSPSKAILMCIALIKTRAKFVPSNENFERKIKEFKSIKMNCNNTESIYPTIHKDDVSFLYDRYGKKKKFEGAIKDFKSIKMNYSKTEELQPTIHNDDYDVSFLYDPYGKKEKFTNIIRCLIYEVTYILLEENNLERIISDEIQYQEELYKNTKKRKKSFQKKEIDINNPLIRIDGKKSKQLIDKFNPILAKGSENHPAYAEPFTGTTSVFCHLDTEFNNYELNDLNSRTLNFIKVIQNFPYEFKLHLSMLKCNKDVFSNIKEHSKKCNNNFKNKIEDALCFFFLNYCSFRNNHSSFRFEKEMYRPSQIKYLQTIKKIDHFHQKYEGVKITKSNAFYFIEKHIDCSDMLLYVDSPYPYTEHYYKCKNTPKKQKPFNHKKLAELLCAFKGNFVYSCRTTFSLGNQKKGFPNYEMVRTIDKLYKGKNLYYMDIPYCNKQIERVITNFYFDGAKKYE